MAAKVENDWWENVRKLAQAHDVSARTVYAALMRTAKLSKKSASWVNKRSSLKMTKELFRTCERPKQWRPRFFDSLRHRSHCLRGGQGRRESWPTSFSLRRPPRRDRMGVREIARRRTLPRRSGGNESASWNARRSLAAILTKAKNTKCRNYNCFFVLWFSVNHVFTPRMYVDM